jgi:hypothetical protein
MTIEQNAMTLAVEAYKTPSRLRHLSTGAVPSGMFLVIKAAAGDDATLLEQSELHRMSVENVRDAAKHFLLRHLLDPNVRGLQLLGLSEGAKEADIKNHKRWLQKWLHPDRNPSMWEQQLFKRISELKVGDQVAVASSLAPVVSAHKSRHRRSTWTLANDRHKDVSRRRALLRFMVPLIAGAAGVVILAGLINAKALPVDKMYAALSAWMMNGESKP